jgi:vacuolar-type H+-ATPase subunit E/Vma4
MYIVDIHNGETVTEIHGLRSKLKSGNVAKGINCIDSFSFSMLPNNPGFSRIFDFQTLVNVWNTNKNRYDFQGRVLCSAPAMEESGAIVKEVTCESFFGFLCDSVQKYVEEKNWTPRELLTHIIECHNSQVEEYKHFAIGEVSDDLDPNNNLYIGIQRTNSWKTIEEKLLNKLGGEIRFRVVDGVIYIDYLKKIGETRSTKIELSRNMKSIRKESDPSAYITRLIPLGAKLTKEVTNENGETENVEIEERLTIANVNDGKDYIDDTTAIKAYGIHVGYLEFDDVTSASILLTKARNWLAENNKVQVKYAITALDLSLLGLDIDDFNVHDYHPIVNSLLGIDDTARIIKKNIDVCEEIRSTIEVGDNFKTLTEIQREQAEKLNNIGNEIAKEVESATSKLEEKVEDIVEEKVDEPLNDIRQTIEERHTSAINTAEAIILSALESYVQTSNYEEFKQTVETQLSVMADEIEMNFTTTTEQITDVDGELQSKFNQLYKYIKFSGDTAITIGSGDSAITLEIDNETGIIFKKNGVQFGLWDGENFHTGNLIIGVNERAQFGAFAFVPRSDGSLSFLKVGG